MLRSLVRWGQDHEGDGRMGVSRARVVEWATGWIGTIALRAIARRPDLELVGVWVHNPEKVGQDAGELAGIERMGVDEATYQRLLDTSVIGDRPLGL